METKPLTPAQIEMIRALLYAMGCSAKKAKRWTP